MSLLGNAEEFATLILAEFEMKSLPFDLNFLRFENAVHLKNLPESNELSREIGSKICAVRGRKLFGKSGF